MTVGRVRVISAHAPFRRGGLSFGQAGQPVEISDLDLSPEGILAILREPLLTIQVQGADDGERDGPWETMKPVARLLFAAQAAQLVELGQTHTFREEPIEGAASNLAGGPGDADPTSTFDGKAFLGTFEPEPKDELMKPPPANATATASAQGPKPAKPPKAPMPAPKKAG